MGTEKCWQDKYWYFKKVWFVRGEKYPKPTLIFLLGRHDIRVIPLFFWIMKGHFNQIEKGWIQPQHPFYNQNLLPWSGWQIYF